MAGLVLTVTVLCTCPVKFFELKVIASDPVSPGRRFSLETIAPVHPQDASMGPRCSGSVPVFFKVRRWSTTMPRKTAPRSNF